MTEIIDLFTLLKGGDWGALIGTDMAAFFPENVLGNNGCLHVVAG
jgi:hypothetical protein